MAKDISGKAQTARMKAFSGGEMGYETAARRYVNSGLDKLDLKPREKEALRAKLTSIVARQMGAERGRAAARGAGMASREAKAKVAKAKKSIL